MRRRKSIAAVAAVGGFAVAGLAVTPFANANEPDQPVAAEAVSAAAVGTVVLPTGDRVTVAPNGVKGFEPAAGREDVGHLVLDDLVVPVDRVEAIESGAEDARRYDVAQLLAGGHTDAAAVPEADLDPREYDGLVPADDRAVSAAETQTVTVTTADHADAVPEWAWLNWYDAATGDRGPVMFDETGNGTGTAELPSGEYLIYGGVWNERNLVATEMVSGVVAVTVADDPVDVRYGGSEASPVTVDVEQPDAVYDGAHAAAGFRSPFDEPGRGRGLTSMLGPDADFYVLPEPELPDGFELDFMYQPRLVSPAGAEEPYRYDLSFAETGGYPEDLSFTVADEELSIEETTYNGFGIVTRGRTCDNGDAGSFFAEWCRETWTQAPSTRTNYRSAGPEVSWAGYSEFGVFDEEGFYLLDGFSRTYQDRVLEVGRTAFSENHGPIGGGTAQMLVESESDLAYTELSLWAAGGHNGETLDLLGYEGTVKLSLDGEVLGSFDDANRVMGLYAELPDAGRYSLTSKSSRGTDVVPFGTNNTLAWEFDFDPAEIAEGEPSVLSIPVVGMSADGVQGGYADASEPLDVTLDLAVDRNAEPVTAESMTFQVSYDEGGTWIDVPIDLDCGTATATLDFPEGAEFVSTRFFATDDAGTEVEQTTIRSFGLK
ncbi:hypothetical protein [Glycomyces dulcitolivorans]|uniref:hypothetical protein n=1 Tax=Glycomyces dulcitolivorans TaxID=2200759 RepID=UPI0013005F55|nr:hypothetical protein [Glycomyces dulcitolivorans]